MNTIVSNVTRYPQHPTLFSAFDLSPDALAGLTTLWRSTRCSWIIKTEQLHGALLLTPFDSSIREELKFLIDLAWNRHFLEKGEQK